ncbi:MAG: EutN/CcmL family microcompartment protein [Phycisphaerae bacterium]
MYLGRIIGQIEARMRLPGLETQRIVLLQPLDFNEQPIRWTMLAVDITGASEDSLVAFEEGREAANPFAPPLPVDACVVAIIDEYQYQP